MRILAPERSWGPWLTAPLHPLAPPAEIPCGPGQQPGIVAPSLDEALFMEQGVALFPDATSK